MLGLANNITGGSVIKEPETFSFQMTPQSVVLPNIILEYDLVISGVLSSQLDVTDAKKHTFKVLTDGIDLSGVTASNYVRLNGTATLTVTRAATDYTVTLYLYATTQNISDTVSVKFSPVDATDLTDPFNQELIQAADFTPSLPDLTDGQLHVNIDTASLVINAIDPDPVINDDTYDATNSSAFTNTYSVFA
jgi:hypothetical protein